jgi:hypothetical protein
VTNGGFTGSRHTDEANITTKIQHY